MQPYYSEALRNEVGFHCLLDYIRRHFECEAFGNYTYLLSSVQPNLRLQQMQVLFLPS